MPGVRTNKEVSFSMTSHASGIVFFSDRILLFYAKEAVRSSCSVSRSFTEGFQRVLFLALVNGRVGGGRIRLTQLRNQIYENVE